MMGLHEEGIGWAREAIEIFERLGDTKKLVECLTVIADLFRGDQKLDAAEEAALRALNLSSGRGWESRLCDSHRVLSYIYQSKGETEKAIHHSETLIGIASVFGWKFHLFRAHVSLSHVFREEGRLEDAQTHVERAKSQADSAYQLAYVMTLQGGVFSRQGRFEEAKSELLRAIDAFEKLAATVDVERCREVLTKQLNVEVSSS